MDTKDSDPMTRKTKNKLLVSTLLLALIPLLFSSCSGLKKSSQMSSSGPKKEGEIHLEVKKFELDNGLRLLVYENHKLPIFTYQTFFDVGGRHEGPGTTGATHFLEHMMFKGAKKYGPGVFFRLIESNGGNSNAYTNFDNTVYYESLPVKSGDQNMVEVIVDLEADRMQHLSLEPKAFEKERQVVLEERKNRYENSPRGQLYLALTRNIFEGTPYGGSVIGDVKDLHSLNRDQVMGYFKKFYRPDNAIIVVSGDVNAEDVYELVKDKYGDIKPSDDEIQKYRETREQADIYKHRGRYGRHIKIHNKQALSPMFMLGFPADPIGSREGFVRDILSSILGQGESSYLNEKYVTGKNPYFTSLMAANYTLKHNGVFWIAGEVARGKSLNRTTNRLLRETKRLCDKAITERSLQKTKNQYMLGYISEIETNDGVAQFLGLREAFFKDYRYYKKEIEIYNSITVDEVKSSCSSLFNGGKHILVSIWNKHPAKN